MVTELNQESKLQVSSVIGELVDDAMLELLESGVEFRDGITKIGQAVSPTWELPHLWDDQDMADPIMVDLDYSQYANLFTPGSSGIIAASTVSQRTAGLILAGLLASVASYFGFRKAMLAVAFVYDWFFGLKPTIKGVGEQVNQVQDTLEQMIKSSSPFSNVTSQQVDTISHQVVDIVRMLAHADIEITSLATALFTDNKHEYVPHDWLAATKGFFSDNTLPEGSQES
jgi:hypothetical protein